MRLYKKKRKTFRAPDVEEKPVFVISAIRIYFGGSLEVVNDFLLHLNDHQAGKFRFIAYVYRKELYKRLPNIELREVRYARKSVFFRLWMEYAGFYFISRKLKPNVWFSMQDSTPIVQAKYQFTYWHSPLLQRGFKIEDLYQQPRLFFLTFLYKYFYSKNIRSNTGIFVQQHASAEFLKQRFQLPSEKLHVAPLVVRLNAVPSKQQNQAFIFLYPSFPYAYKNFKQVVHAARLAANADERFEIWLTASGEENKYIRDLKRKASDLSCLKWIGYQSLDDLRKMYGKADALLYVSEYETWGIPISVFKKMKKPIITVDLPYAYETAGEYQKVKFVRLHDEIDLADAIIDAVNDNLMYDPCKPAKQNVLFDWHEVFNTMTNSNEENYFGHIRRRNLRSADTESL